MVTEQFTIEIMKDAKYVVVGMEQKSDKDTKIVGYFLGLRGLVDTNIQIVSKNDTYVWLMKGETVHILNLDQYEIVSIGIRVHGSGTKYSASDDALSLSRLKIVQEALAVSGMVRPNGLIDVSKFTDIPADIKQEVEDDVKITYTDTGSKATTTSTHRPPNINRKAVGYTASTYKKKEVSTTTFKRTSKYPITAALDRMYEKIVAMENDTYTPPKLPEIPGDKIDPEAEKKDSATTDEQREWDEAYGGMHGLPLG